MAGCGRAARHDVRRQLQGSLGFASAGFCVLLFLIPFSTAGIPGDSIFSVAVTHMQMKFRFIGDDFMMAVQAFAVLYGFAFGLLSFRFVLDQRTASVYFTLGVSRVRLYLNRFLVGAALLAVTIIIPMAVSLTLNLIALEPYQGMTAAFLYVSAGIFVTALAAFAVAAVGCLLAGTMPEAVFFSAALLAVPYVLSSAANVFMKHLLWGNPFGAMPFLGNAPAAPSVTDMLSSANPVLFFFDDLETHRMFYRPLETDTPEKIAPAILAVWVAVVIVVALLGLMIMRKRRAEQAGFASKNPVVTRVCAFVPLLFACALAFDLSAGVSLAFGFAALVVIFALCVFGGDRLLLSARPHAPSIAVRAFLLLVCTAGAVIGYGAYTSLPDAEGVTAVSVSYVGTPSYVGVPALGSSTGHDYYFSAAYSFTDAADIALARHIHGEIADGGRKPLRSGEGDDFTAGTVVPYDVSFTYTLESGKTKTWYYDRASLAQLRSLLAFENTEPVRLGRDAVLAGQENGDAPPDMLWAREAFNSGEIFLADPTYRSMFSLSIDAKNRTQLLAAIRADVSAQKTGDRYFPTGEPLGILMFTFDGEHDVDSFSYHLNNSFVYIDEGFENTLSYLKENSLWFDDGMARSVDPDEVETLIVQPYDPYIGINKPNFPQSPYFMSYLSDSPDDFRILKDFGEKDVVKDPERKEKIVSEMRSNYFLSEAGSLVAVKYKGSNTWVYKFWPGAEDSSMNDTE
jgi:ABC-2 type transport system permease protein